MVCQASPRIPMLRKQREKAPFGALRIRRGIRHHDQEFLRFWMLLPFFRLSLRAGEVCAENAVMPWRIVRLWIELSSALAVVPLFQSCGTLADVWVLLQRLDELQRIGMIAAVVIIVTGIGETVQALGSVLRPLLWRKPAANRWQRRHR